MASDKTVHLTPEGRDRLEQELRDLVENRRPVIVQRVATARAEGDLSENFAYHDARQELGLLDGRVQTIKATLRNAQVL
ncbi:MAG: transcription elongation factor GreA, partial [Candidatus Dormibacteraeota bacterium]|nr:transcription elongation factor GreA [Candidatus Dormibacteraeota bacterium]